MILSVIDKHSRYDTFRFVKFEFHRNRSIVAHAHEIANIDVNDFLRRNEKKMDLPASSPPSIKQLTLQKKQTIPFQAWLFLRIL